MSPIALANAGGKGGEFFGTDLTGAFAAKTLSHGIVGGVMSVLQGGKFGHGFASAGVTQAFAGKIDKLGHGGFSSKRVLPLQLLVGLHQE